MHSLKNDNDEMAIAVGAPGSPARLRQQYPKLLATLNALYTQGSKSVDRDLPLALQQIQAAGLAAGLETENMLRISHYGLATWLWRK